MATSKATPRMGFLYPTEENVAWYSVFKSMMLQMDAAAFASREDRNAMLSGGGTLSWNATTGALTWTDTLDVLSPTTAAVGELAAGSATLEDGDGIVVTLTRYATVTYALSSSVAQSVPSDDNSFLLVRRSGDLLYWRNGVVMPDGFEGTLAVRVLSDDIMDALEAAEAPDATNEFVTVSAMNTAIAAAIAAIVPPVTPKENLTVQVDGVTALFTTSAPYNAGTLQVYLNGLHQLGPGDGQFVETDPATGQFTMTAVPPLGTTLYVLYMGV